jgi:hypothetical protein
MQNQSESIISGALSQPYLIKSYWQKVLAITILLVVVSMLTGMAQNTKSDSLPNYTLVLNPRINSAGYFPYTGAYLNKHPSFDFNLFYNRKAWGFFVFKSVDLEDEHSYVNYLQPGIFKNININRKLSMRAFFGYIFSQADGFRDGDSDYYTALVVSWEVAPNIKFENTSLFFDLQNSAKYADRVYVNWTVGKFRLDFYVWQRTVFENNFNSTSGSIGIAFPKINITNSWSIQNTLSYIGYITEDKPDFSMRDGFLFTLALPLTIQR